MVEPRLTKRLDKSGPNFEKCRDVTSKVKLLNSWACRNCFRLRANYRVRKIFTNRDTLIFEFTEDVKVSRE